MKPKARAPETAAGKKPRPSGRTDHLEKDEVLAAAQQLHDAAPIRVHERLSREAAAERVFGQRFAARWQAMDERERQGVPYDLLEELASERGGEILESPSFRDYLALLIRRRRDDYGRYSRQSDRVANALFGKRKDGAPPRSDDVFFDEIKLKNFEAFHEALRRAKREIPASLTREREISREIKARGFAMRPPAEPRGFPKTPLPSSITPEALFEQQKRTFNERHLPGLARHLSEHRRPSSEPGEEESGRVLFGKNDLSLRAIVWLLETWPEDCRYSPPPVSRRPKAKGKAKAKPAPVDPDLALRELRRLRKNGRRRMRDLGDTTG